MTNELINQLKYSYLVLFHLTSQPNLSVYEFKRTSDTESIFREDVITNLEVTLQAFKSSTEGINLSSTPDNVKWKWSAKENFTVKECYLFLSIAKINWRILIPLKLKIFNWLLFSTIKFWRLKTLKERISKLLFVALYAALSLKLQTTSSYLYWNYMAENLHQARYLGCTIISQDLWENWRERLPRRISKQPWDVITSRPIGWYGKKGTEDFLF